MAEKRADKRGFAKEAQEKMSSKWDSERAQIAIKWIGEKIGEPLPFDGSMDAAHKLFYDGLRLAKLANWVEPGSIAANKLTKAPSMAFRQMELISMFLKVAEKWVKKNELFQTVDLFENQNMVQVIIGFEALGRALITAGRDGFGKAESKGTHHEWTEEQLREGQNIIGLQMGSNKGASQAGQNFGKTRSIMD